MKKNLSATVTKKKKIGDNIAQNEQKTTRTTVFEEICALIHEKLFSRFRGIEKAKATLVEATVKHKRRRSAMFSSYSSNDESVFEAKHGSLLRITRESWIVYSIVHNLKKDISG
jgi:hypothetical protein